MEETKKTKKDSFAKDLLSIIAIVVILCVILFNTNPREITVNEDSAAQKISVDREDVIVNFRCRPENFPLLLKTFMKKNKDINLEKIDSSEGEIKVTFRAD